MPDRITIAALVLLLALVATPPAAAQVVRGALVEEGTHQPVAGALVVLLGADGSQLAGGLTGSDGQFIIRAPAAGTYALRAERIGFRSTATAPFRLETGQTLEKSIITPAEAVNLGGIHVEARRRCTLRPEEGTATHDLWEEVRKALNSADWAQREALFRFHIVDYERAISVRTGQVRREDVKPSTRIASRAYRSAPAADLIDNGWVRDTIYFAPDAAVLLSDEFSDAYCFSLVRPVGPADEGLIGLGFAPQQRSRRGDIEGVLWVHRASAELRRLDYRFTGITADGPTDRLGGEVMFERLPTGAWIVARWTMRMPLLAVRERRDSRREVGGYTRPFIAGILEREGVVERVEFGGRTITLTAPRTAPPVEAVAQAESSTPITGRADDVADTVPALQPPAAGERLACGRAGDATAGMLHGVVLNASNGVPLAGARVTVSWTTNDATVAGARDAQADFEGHFRVCDVPTGVPLRAVAAYGRNAGPAAVVSIGPDGVLARNLEVDARATVWIGARRFRAAPQPLTLSGTVVDLLTGEPIADAEVRLADTSRRARADSAGRFTLADVPAGLYTVEVRRDGYETLSLRLALGSDGLDLQLSLAPQP